VKRDDLLAVRDFLKTPMRVDVRVPVQLYTSFLFAFGYITHH